jgi:hypothetical protein
LKKNFCKYSIILKYLNFWFFLLQILVFLNVELPRDAIIRNYRRGMNAKRTLHHKILSRAFKRSFRRNSKSFLKAERRERNSAIIQWMARTNRNGKHRDRGEIDAVLNSWKFYYDKKAITIWHSRNVWEDNERSKARNYFASEATTSSYVNFKMIFH